MASVGGAQEPQNGQNFFEIKTETITALSNQMDLVYAEAGPKDGGIVIAVHGAPATHKMFKKMAQPLVEKGYRVIVPNLPGMGWTPLPESGCYNHTPRHKAEVIAGLIEALSIKERVTPWSFYKYASYLYYWMAHIPLLGTGVVYATNPFFTAVGLRGKTKMSQVYSLYEVALFEWEEFASDLSKLHDHGMGALVVHGDDDWFIQLEIAEDNARRLGVLPENTVWYKNGEKSGDDIKDDVLKRAMFVEGGDHFIFMKQIDILSHEQLSLLRALERRKKSMCKGEEN